MRRQGQDRVELLGLGAKDWISKMQNSDSGSEYELLVKEATNTFCLITNTESVSSADLLFHAKLNHSNLPLS